MGGVLLPAITSTNISEFLSLKASATSASTAARYYDTLRTFFCYLHEYEHIPINPMRNVKKPKFSRPIIQPLSQDEVEALIASTAGKTFTNIRNRLVILILVDCGLRVSELTELNIDDIIWEDQYFIIRHGKGDKSRRVPFGNAVASLLRVYLSRRAGVKCPNLIVTCYGLSTDRYRIATILEIAAADAKLGRTHIGPHLLRHTFAVSYLRAGGDVFSLQKCLGHATLDMTRHYAEIADTDVLTKHRAFSPGDRLAMPHDGTRNRLK
jgi:site-specific recombinase XerD